MALAHPRDTDERAVPAAVRRFLRNRLYEALGLLLLGGSVSLALALASWSPMDPALDPSLVSGARNWLGPVGAHAADSLLKAFGLAAILFFLLPLGWSARLLSHRPPGHAIKTTARLIAAAFSLAGFLSLALGGVVASLAFGPGGSLGAVLSDLLTTAFGFFLHETLARIFALVCFGTVAISTSLNAMGFSGLRARFTTMLFGEWMSDLIEAALGSVSHGLLALRGRFGRSAKPRRLARPADFVPQAGAPNRARHFWSGWLGQKSGPRVEPRLAGGGVTESGERIEPRLLSGGDGMPFVADDDLPDEAEVLADDTFEDHDFEGEEEEQAIPRVTRTNRTIRPGKRARADEQPSFFPSREAFLLPPLPLLAEAKHNGRGADLSDEALEANARLLEGVLEDFGVRGEITKVHPGPVVTLYELEPAPGIKSSRVIGLADDIARSMSAVSARVAVVPGRNAIGIELPNQRRETVFLRELLGSEAFENTTQGLCLALGKNIGGDPVFADLARMPHLLIAGTTGSGKSVGINTMILSLLYRMPPEQCRLIMIDPKMLELSVYEGIPHLLAPVVTDPKKAVVALKWAVREMEDRYRKMSKLGVRNIDGYNTRLKQVMAKGETMSRTVQTGYDPASGQPIFETEQIEMQPMPFIVVIIDEMADLMMVAGKEIEGAVQRLAQMARAAGIHVVMATQRPSVDVITGTIKANFPTRISFQVTSKIDSRTILGEQGAEQLLGQGDMLYMAGGGRISRLHAPFVTDEEVEKIVRHLKKQGAPEYIEAVTEEPDEEFGAMDPDGPGSGDALYDQAVAVVLRDRKVSTSYVQRRLQIGYNKAASLIERMEQEGLISPANSTGKREILAGEAA